MMRLNIPNGVTLPSGWSAMSRAQKRAWSKQARRVEAAPNRAIHEGRLTREGIDMLEGGDGFVDVDDDDSDFEE